MNATEAAKISATAKARLDKEKEIQARKDKAIRIRRERIDRLKFIKDFTDDCRWHINSYVKDGAKSTRVWIGSQENEPSFAQNQFDKHTYIAEIQKIMADLRKEGYKVEQGVEESKHSTQHESTVPDYDYYLYHAYIEISW